jgi:uncharacterized integral membrane protein
MPKEEKDILEHAENLAKEVDKTIQKGGKHVFKKYPLTFATMGMIGFAAVLFGLEGLINQISFLINRPWLILVIGIALLVLSGTLYEWFQNREIDLHK